MADFWQWLDSPYRETVTNGNLMLCCLLLFAGGYGLGRSAKR